MIPLISNTKFDRIDLLMYRFNGRLPKGKDCKEFLSKERKKETEVVKGELLSRMITATSR